MLTIYCIEYWFTKIKATICSLKLIVIDDLTHLQQFSNNLKFQLS